MPKCASLPFMIPSQWVLKNTQEFNTFRFFDFQRPQKSTSSPSHWPQPFKSMTFCGPKLHKAGAVPCVSLFLLLLQDKGGAEAGGMAGSHLLESGLTRFQSLAPADEKQSRKSGSTPPAKCKRGSKLLLQPLAPVNRTDEQQLCNGETFKFRARPTTEEGSWGRNHQNSFTLATPFI